MHKDNNDRDMSKFVEFADLWGGLSYWQRLRIYLHVIIQYKGLGFLAIVATAIFAAWIAFMVSDNIYISLVTGGVAGAITASY